jgi:hypothetical protein
VRKSFTRIAVLGVAVAAVAGLAGLAGGSALAAGSSASDGAARPPSADDVVIGDVANPDAVVGRLDAAIRGLLDAAGLGGGAEPAPSPGTRPDRLINGAIQTVSKTGSDVALGLGGIVVPPVPSPTPGIEPDPGGRNTRLVNDTIKAVSKAGSDVALGLGGIVVPPLPSPTPGIKPPIALP